MTGVRENKDIYHGCTSKAYKAYQCFRITLYIVLLILVAFVIKDCASPSVRDDANGSEMVGSTEDSTISSFEDLLDAIEWVESRGDANAVGDNGKAVGCMQIWKSYVDDCNRIHNMSCNALMVRHPAYKYSDRLSRDLSRSMASLYMIYYWERTQSATNMFEFMARIHNGGPDGYKSPDTEKYWLKIKDYLDKL